MQKKITRNVKQKNMTYNHKKTKSIETEPENKNDRTKVWADKGQ